MRKRLEERLEGLKTEFEEGQRLLMELQAKQANLKDTLLRISGAIQVLEEELTQDTQVAAPVSETSENPEKIALVNA